MNGWDSHTCESACTPPWQSVPAAGAGGDLVPVEPVRVLDTKRGTGLDAPCRLEAPTSWRPRHPGLPMSAERWGLVIGLITIVTIRVVDWFMPKGYHSLWAERHGTKTPDKEESDNVDE